MKIKVGPMQSYHARALRTYLRNRSVLSEIINHADAKASVLVHVPNGFDKETITGMVGKAVPRAAPQYEVVE